MFIFYTLFALSISFSGDTKTKDFKKKTVGTITSYETDTLKASYDSNINAYMASYGASDNQALWMKTKDPKKIFELMEKTYLKHKIAEEVLISLEKKIACKKEER